MSLHIKNHLNDHSFLKKVLVSLPSGFFPHFLSLFHNNSNKIKWQSNKDRQTDRRLTMSEHKKVGPPMNSISSKVQWGGENAVIIATITHHAIIPIISSGLLSVTLLFFLSRTFCYDSKAIPMRVFKIIWIFFKWSQMLAKMITLS